MKRIGTKLCAVTCAGIVLTLLSAVQPVFADITYSDGGIHNISTSMTVDSITVANGSTLNVLSGGSITAATDSSENIILTFGNSPVNIYGGTITSNVGIESSGSPLNMYGGTITSCFGISVINSSSVNMYGGTITTPTGASGGYGISAFSGPVNIYGGTIISNGGFAISANNSAQTNIFGGIISSNGGWAIQSYGMGSMVNVYGGQINGTILPQSSGVVDIFGSGFNYGYGQIGATSGTLTGTLADGTPIDVAFDNDGGQIILSANPTPIPASAYLFGSGLLGLIGIRKKMQE